MCHNSQKHFDMWCICSASRRDAKHDTAVLNVIRENFLVIVS
jgi:hypothetical protein